LASSDTAAFYLNKNEWMQCLDLEHGTLLWEGRPGDHAGLFGYVVPYGNYVLVGGWRGYTRLHCLDARSGALRWQLADGGAYAIPVPGPWRIAAPRLWPSSGVATIHFVAATTGAVYWHVPVPSGACASDWSSSIQRHGDALLLTTEDGTIYRLDPATDQEWQAIGAHADGITTIRPTILGQNLIFMDARGRACAYDLVAARLNWSIEIAAEHNTREHLSAAYLSGHRVVIGTESGGRLITIDATGQLLDARKIGKRIRTGMTSLTEDRIAVGTAGAIIACRIV
jgi:outer membrane protein assembly factor BamB